MGLFTMPSLGADMERGTLLEWRVGIGDRVERGDIVAVVDTEKSTIEVEVFESGVVAELLVEEGTEVDVGTPLARIESDSTAAAPVPPEPEPEPEPAQASLQPSSPGAWHPDDRPPGRVLSPLVRREAAARHVDVDHLAGTGPDHRVTRDDVVRAAAGAATEAPSPRSRAGASPLARVVAERDGIDLAGVVGSGPHGAVRVRDLPPAPLPSAAPAPAARPAGHRDSTRGAIARLTTTANREIPHYHVLATIDLHLALEQLRTHNADRSASERVLVAAVLLHATARALAATPELNGHWVDGGFRPADGVHLGVIVSQRGGGLMAPVIHGADRLTLDETMATLRDLVVRTRRGELRGSELTGASCTVTDLGERGADVVVGVIHPPQVALVGFGGVVERPLAVDGRVVVHPTVTATLSGDHRATDGLAGSRFLERLRDLLEHPPPAPTTTEGP